MAWQHRVPSFCDRCACEDSRKKQTNVDTKNKYHAKVYDISHFGLRPKDPMEEHQEGELDRARQTLEDVLRYGEVLVNSSVRSSYVGWSVWWLP
jgi:hypothetical protein